jgi:Lon protease-like protein
VADVIPLFPLGQVLLPGMPLPLHIFEPRYRKMLADITAPGARRAFGVVALRRGSEVGDPAAQFSDTGTLAELTEVVAQPEGTSDLLAVGSRRFRVERLVPGAPYLRAEVEMLPEVDGGVTPQLRNAARHLQQIFDARIGALTGETPSAPLPDDAGLLSYRLAARLPLPPADRQALLEEPTDAARLNRAVRLQRRELALLGATRTIAVSPVVLQLPARPN